MVCKGLRSARAYGLQGRTVRKGLRSARAYDLQGLTVCKGLRTGRAYGLEGFGSGGELRYRPGAGAWAPTVDAQGFVELSERRHKCAQEAGVLAQLNRGEDGAADGEADYEHGERALDTLLALAAQLDLCDLAPKRDADQRGDHVAEDEEESRGHRNRGRRDADREGAPCMHVCMHACVYP